ncbi:5-bromo-4-chloroindolyl phosphate hydrolysis family protein [Pseudolactococcus reticulitermitis]|uniref:5-bromo-4-chloroindolyl phosphate hydrolysis protein n=1 Tax=Pseudolactococcus reticulitermitis TaxID=2025039 RepID=A0A224WZV2_9LACT|nr:5-bromo-4-chloroindolyl phosphate hydrolysis family protein [Lactococcus reticulitermitis]GAX47557.1 hypothetical protein RsY01_1157 [Lactococcus reticulitermitis]
MYYIILISILILVLLFIAFQFIKRVKLKVEQVKKVEQFQSENTLSTRELDIFKTEMKTTKMQILAISASLSLSEELAQEVQVVKAFKASQAIFVYLMNQPKKMIDFGDFLYRSLPSFKNAIENYKTIGVTDVTTDEINQWHHTILLNILDISQSIITDYEKNVENHWQETVFDKKMTERQV